LDISSVSGCYGPVDRVLGLLDATLGELDAAVAHLERSVELCERMPSPPWLALTQHQLAGILEGRGAPGDHERAAELSGTAAEGARLLGITLP
jgi:hypothetical protein